ncbi:MAG: flagellar FliJ family protein [Hyphomonadaceae bacterium]
MKSLHTLLKIAQRKLDELGIEAARAAREVDELQQKIAGIRAREQAEIAAAAANPDYAATLPAYRLRVRWQVDEIGVVVRAKEAELAEIRERLSAAYIEKSKLEQLIEQGRVREETERQAREQAMLDEVAINRAGAQGK